MNLINKDIVVTCMAIDATHLAARKLGFRELRKLQVEVIQAIATGNDVFVVVCVLRAFLDLLSRSMFICEIYRYIFVILHTPIRKDTLT